MEASTSPRQNKGKELPARSGLQGAVPLSALPASCSRLAEPPKHADTLSESPANGTGETLRDCCECNGLGLVSVQRSSGRAPEPQAKEARPLPPWYWEGSGKAVTAGLYRGESIQMWKLHTPGSSALLLLQVEALVYNHPAPSQASLSSLLSKLRASRGRDPWR